jgi:hypothetical protein
LREGVEGVGERGGEGGREGGGRERGREKQGKVGREGKVEGVMEYER